MIEVVVALLMIVNGEIKEHRIQESMSTCLKAKRIAMRSGTSRIDYQCIKSKAETEIYLGEKSIVNLILKQYKKDQEDYNENTRTCNTFCKRT